MSLEPSPIGGHQTNAVLALFTRALRADDRLRATYFARSAVVGFVLIVLLNTQAFTGALGAPGLLFFKGVIRVNLWFISLTTLGYFASAVTEEREEQMLGLLRMTGISALAILLGKSTSRQFGALMLLLVQVPFTLLAVTLGGVSTGQVVAAYASLGAYVFLLGNMALLASVICTNTRSAAILTGIGLLLFLVLPWPLEELWKWLAGPASPFFRWWKDASPFVRVEAILTTGFTGRAFGFQVAADVVLGVAFFLTAWGGFEAFTRTRLTAESTGTTLRRGTLAAQLGAGRVWHDWAVAWKDYHFFWGGLRGLVFRVALYSIITALIGVLSFFNEGRGYLVMVIGGVALAVEATLLAARLFRSEMEAKTLSTLAMLPTSLGRMAAQKTAAAGLTLIPSAAMFFVGLCWTSTGFRSAPTYLAFWYALAICTGEAVLFLSFVTLCSLKMRLLAVPAAVAATFAANLLLLYLTMIFSLPWGGHDADGLVRFLMSFGAIGVMDFLVIWNIGLMLPQAAAEH